jgi:ATP-dependent DNA helicase RecQ
LTPQWQHKKSLSCVYRTEEHFGASYVIDVLLGNDTERITNFGHHKISTFGVGKEYSKDKWRSIFRQLVAKRLLLVDIEGHGGYCLGGNCKPIFLGKETVLLREESFSKKIDHSKVKKSKKIKTHTTLSNKEDQNLFQTLCTHRLELASEQKIPPICYFSRHYIIGNGPDKAHNNYSVWSIIGSRKSQVRALC